MQAELKRGRHPELLEKVTPKIARHINIVVRQLPTEDPEEIEAFGSLLKSLNDTLDGRLEKEQVKRQLEAYKEFLREKKERKQEREKKEQEEKTHRQVAERMQRYRQRHQQAAAEPIAIHRLNFDNLGEKRKVPR